MFLSIQYPVLFSILTLNTLCSSVFSTRSCFLFILLILYVPQYSVSCLVLYSYSWYFMFSVFSTLSCFLFILLILYVPQYSVPCLVLYSYSWYLMFLSIQYPVLFSIHTLDTSCSSVFSTLSCFLFILLTLYVTQYSVPCLVFYSYSWHFMFLSIQYPVLFSIHTLNTLCSSVFSALSCFLFILLTLYVPQYSVPCLVLYSYFWHFMFLSIQYPVLFSIHTLDTLCSSVFSTLSCFLFINTLCSSVFSTLSCFLFILLTLYVPQYSVPCLVFYSYSWYFMFLSIQYPVLFSIHTLDTLCSSVFSTLSCFLFILLILYVPQYSVPCLVFIFILLTLYVLVFYSYSWYFMFQYSVSCLVFYSYSWHFMFLSIQYPVLFSIHTLDTLCSSVFSTLSCIQILYVPQYSVPCLVLTLYSYSWYFMFLSSIQYPVLFSIHTLNTLCSSVFSTLSCFLFILLTLYVPQYSVPCLVFYSYSWYFMFLSIQYPVLFSIHTLNTLCSSVFSTLSCFLFILNTLCSSVFSTLSCFLFILFTLCSSVFSTLSCFLFILFTLCSSVFSTLSCFLFILLILYVP